jgi:hypothetical protein
MQAQYFDIKKPFEWVAQKAFYLIMEQLNNQQFRIWSIFT